MKKEVIKIRFIDDVRPEYPYQDWYYVRVMGRTIADFVKKIHEYLDREGTDWYQIECEYVDEKDLTDKKVLNIPTFKKYLDYNIICGIDVPKYHSDYFS